MIVEERRRFQRFDFRLPASIEVMDSYQGKEKIALSLQTGDVSGGGAFFHTAQSLPKGTRVRVRMVLGFKSRNGREAFIEVKGKVVRSESRGMAVCFDKHYQMRPHDGGNLT